MTEHVEYLTDHQKPIYGLEPLITEQQLSEILRYRAGGRTATRLASSFSDRVA